jgi:polyisoprenoid-binding protein YceI
MIKASVIAVLALTASLVACADSAPPAASAPTGTIGVTTTPAAPALNGTFNFSAAGSKIEWTGAKTSGHHDGGFSAFTGAITIPGSVDKGSVTVDIDINSLTVNDPALGPMADKLVGHLKSPDFFDAAKFPKGTFVSTAVTPGAAGAPYTVAGNLTFHGITKPITFPATITPSATGIDASATFDINRKDFGLNLAGKPDDLIKDNVQVRLTIHAAK